MLPSDTPFYYRISPLMGFFARRKHFFVRFRQALTLSFSGNTLLISAIIIFLAVVFAEAAILKFGTGTFLHFGRREKVSEANINESGEMQRWSKIIDQKGGEKAYEDFKSEYSSLHFGKQHTLSHLFGALLYQKMGVAGVGVCDSSFSFGCYHGFFGEAIAREGIGVAKTLDAACAQKFGSKGLGCPHGLGHGILSSLGEDKLQEALDICDTLTWKGPIGGCTSGVLMEYNFKTMQSPGNLILRPLDPKDPYAPCSSLPAKFLQACYFELPDWWEKVYSGDYTKVGSLCSKLDERLMRESCFRGTGTVAAPSSDFDVAKTIEKCKKMPSVDDEILCRAGASWSFYAQVDYKNLAGDLCEGISGELKKLCVQKFEEMR